MAIAVKLFVDTKTGEIALKQFENNAKNTGDKAGQKFSSGFGGGLKSLAGKVAGVATLLGTVFVGFAGKGVFDAAKKIEKIETQFEVLTGSASAAKKQINDLIKFSASTPFQLEGLADTTASLLSFGIAQEKIMGTLKTLGDVAAGSNRPIKEIGLIFGQVKAAGKLTGERLLQLQERAVNVGPALAKHFGVAETSIKGLVSSGKVGFKDLEIALESMTRKGGIFENATAKQSKTIGGLWSTLQDNIFALQIAIGKAFGPVIKEVINDAITAFQKLTTAFIANKDEIMKSLFTFGRAVNAFIVSPIEFAVKVVQNAFNGIMATIDVVAGAIDKLRSEGERGAEQMRSGFEEFKVIKDDLFNFENSDSFDKWISKMEETALRVEEPMKKIKSTIGKTMGDVGKTVNGTGKAMANTVNQVMVKTMSAGISAIATSLIAGGEGFSGFGKKVAGILGSLATQLGETLLLAGVGIESLKSLGGSAAIAAGVGLIALGAILSSIGGSSGAPTSSPPAGGGVASGGGAEDQSITEQSSEEERKTNQNIQLVVNGDILDSEETGTRLLSLLNDNFENTGGKFTGATFA